MLAQNNDPPHTRCGGLLSAFGTDWGLDKLGEPGEKLKRAADALSIEHALDAAKKAIEQRLGELSSEKKSVQDISQQPLRELSTLLTQTMSSYQQKVATDSKRKALNNQVIQLRRQMEQLQLHPLSRGKAPGGMYRVMIELDTATRIPLVDLDFPKP